MTNAITKSFDIGDGRTITLETNKLAKQCDGSVVVKMGNTMLLATLVSAKEGKETCDFMPLSTEYREKYAAAGRFPGGFLKREGRPSDYEILVSRLIDRAIRPLFPSDYHAETFVTVTMISADKEIAPDTLAGLAASAALAISDVPFHGPISEVRVSRIDGKLVINPSITDNKRADIDLIVAATMDNIMMVEGEMSEVSEADMLEAIKVAHDAIKIQCQAQLEFAQMAGVKTKRVYCHEHHDDNLRALVEKETYDKCYQIAKQGNANKTLRAELFAAVKKEFIDNLQTPEQFCEGNLDLVKTLIGVYYHDVEKKAVRNVILNEGIRLDGRTTEQIRPIWSEVDYLPSAHGSAIFTRGETQSLTSVTLGTKLDEQMLDGATNKSFERFLLHYNFPPFATNDAKPYRGVGRREIGHGNLAHRALSRMIPTDETIQPYTIRVVSDILESNGSSSMATVCAGTLALMDAGVKMIKPVSGIAMGLISDSATGKFAVLSDILGDEDHLGDMDFKVTGTKDGITATQMDIKVDGLSYEVLAKALNQAREGRLHILGEMSKTLEAPREDYKPHVPRIETIIIAKEFIGAVIGPGGKVIQGIQADTKTIITITEVGDTGVVNIVSENKDSIEAAKAIVKGIVSVPEVGTVYTGKVKTITAFGAFVEILPGKDGLLHVSEIDWAHIKDVESVYKVGDVVEVKLIEVDKQGKLRLSRKVLLPKPEGYVEPERAPRPERSDDRRGGGYGDRDRGRGPRNNR